MLVKRLLLLAQAVASCAATGSFHQKVKGRVVMFAPWGGNFTNSTNTTAAATRSHASTTLRTTTLDTVAAEETTDKTDDTQANPSTEADANPDKPSETTAAVPEPSDSTSGGGGHRLWAVNATSSPSRLDAPANRTATKAANSTASLPSLLLANTTKPSDTRNATAPLFPAAANSTTPLPSSKNTTSSSNSTTCGIPGSYLAPPTTALKADSILACQASCRRDPTCRSFETGTVDGDGNNCWLFTTPLIPSSPSSSSSPASNVGPVRDGFTWRFYDRDCDLGVRSRCGLRGSFITPPTRKLRVASLAACRAACAGAGAGGCRTFEGGTVDGSGHNCWLFDVPVAELDMGGATTGWQWAFFDRDCKV